MAQNIIRANGTLEKLRKFGMLINIFKLVLLPGKVGVTKVI
tara:strand:+ start:1045 stop:1167 length:123 start_codon:yes stop_codon:yes gene_type:complete